MLATLHLCLHRGFEAPLPACMPSHCCLAGQPVIVCDQHSMQAGLLLLSMHAGRRAAAQLASRLAAAQLSMANGQAPGYIPTRLPLLSAATALISHKQPGVGSCAGQLTCSLTSRTRSSSTSSSSSQGGTAETTALRTSCSQSPVDVQNQATRQSCMTAETCSWKPLPTRRLWVPCLSRCILTDHSSYELCETFCNQGNAVHCQALRCLQSFCVCSTHWAGLCTVDAAPTGPCSMRQLQVLAASASFAHYTDCCATSDEVNGLP